MTGEVKRCTKCGVEKPLTDFNREKKGTFGRRGACKDCLRAQRAGWQAAFMSEPLPATKTCTACGVEKPRTAEFFGRQASTRDGLKLNCRECVKVKNQERYARERPERLDARKVYFYGNREKCLESMRSSYIKHIEGHRARKSKNRALRLSAEGEFNKDDVKRIVKAQKCKCFYCDKDFKQLDSAWHVDHFIPISRGGTNYPENLVIACAFCNMSKHDKMPWEWKPDRFSPPAP